MHSDRLRLSLGPQLTAAILEVSDRLLLLRVNGDHRLPGSLERFHLGVDMLELGVAIGMAGTFARLAIGLQAEVETLQQPPNKLLTGEEAPLGQCRGEMALTQADPPQGRLGITADRRLHQVIQRFQDPRLRLGRGLLSAALPANPLAAPYRPGAEVRQAAADGAARNPGGPRHRRYSTTASSACFTGREHASVSLVEERAECIEAGLDGILVDHSARLDATSPDSLRRFRIRSLRVCCGSESFLATRLFGLGPLAGSLAALHPDRARLRCPTSFADAASRRSCPRPLPRACPLI